MSPTELIYFLCGIWIGAAAVLLVISFRFWQHQQEKKRARAFLMSRENLASRVRK